MAEEQFLTRRQLREMQRRGEAATQQQRVTPILPPELIPEPEQSHSAEQEHAPQAERESFISPRNENRPTAPTPELDSLATSAIPHVASEPTSTTGINEQPVTFLTRRELRLRMQQAAARSASTTEPTAETEPFVAPETRVETSDTVEQPVERPEEPAEPADEASLSAPHHHSHAHAHTAPVDEEFPVQQPVTADLPANMLPGEAEEFVAAVAADPEPIVVEPPIAEPYVTISTGEVPQLTDAPAEGGVQYDLSYDPDAEAAGETEVARDGDAEEEVGPEAGGEFAQPSQPEFAQRPDEHREPHTTHPAPILQPTGSVIVLPQAPNPADVLTSPLDETGEVLLTGTIELPPTIGSTGVVPTGYSENYDDQADTGYAISTENHPVSVSGVIAESTSGRVLPMTRSSRRTTVVLSIIAGALVLVAAGILVYYFFFQG